MSDTGHDCPNDLFVYQSACVGRRIRLLRLTPGSDVDPLILSVEELDLDSSEFRFMAISCAWGDPTDTAVCTCDGKILRITRSLYSALWQLRQEGIEEYIWADAICINQMDTFEKTEQVRMMGDIYAKADLVCIWLGEAIEADEMTLGDNTGIGLMKLICDLLEETPSADSPPPDLTKLGLTGTVSAIWCKMVSLMTRPWFYRAWVVQEYCRSRKYVFRCGPYHIPSDILLGVARRISNYFDLRLLISLHCGQIIQDGLIFGPFFEFVDVNPGEFALVNLLSRASSLKSSDKRDRVFALVGLSSDVKSSLIDYDSDLEDVLRQVATIQIQKILASADPEILFGFLCMVHENDSLGDRSSWAPTFEQKPNYQSLESIFKSEKHLKPTPEVEFEGEKILLVKGRVIDRIQSVLHSEMTNKQILHVNKDDVLEQAEQYKIILASRRKNLELVNKRSKYPTGQDLYEVFWRSLIFDTQAPGERASPEMRSSFEAYQESLALTVVWIEHLAGRHSDSTPEEVLQEIRKVHPQSEWAPQHKTDSSGPDIWAQLRARVKELAPIANVFPKAATLFSWDRLYFDSQLGYVGWIPIHAREGDQICAFAGSRYPFVIRPCEAGFRLIGACYVHGIMEGEAYELPSLGGGGDMMIALV